MSPPHTSAPSPATLTLARIDQPEIELEIKRSRFLGRAARTDTEAQARAFIAQVRSTYPDARHHCSAFILVPADSRPVERSSDDGEPSGTAGQPMLEVLRGSTLTNTTVVVTRYFGGTLLGTGGLVRAYSQATRQALAGATWVEQRTRHLWEVRMPLAQAGRLEAELRALPADLDITTEETAWGPTHATLTLTTATPDATGLAEVLAAHTQGQAVPEAAGSRVVETPLPAEAGAYQAIKATTAPAPTC